MWEIIKNALTGVKEAVGFEIPELPADLGSVRDSAATAVQTVTESAAVALDGTAAATDAVVGSVADVTETVSVDSAAHALTDTTDGPIGDSSLK